MRLDRRELRKFMGLALPNNDPGPCPPAVSWLESQRSPDSAASLTDDLLVDILQQVEPVAAEL